jgi:FHS family L-fucose permease-like MFS transporter
MTEKKNTLVVGMTFMSMIFFIFGFVTTFNITLSAKVKEVFQLSEFMAQLVNGVFFFTYFLLSIASGSIIKKIGYKMGVIVGLFAVGIGSYLFFPAANIPSYPFFLVAIFVMASGVVILQTAANPYVAALGSSATASGRLNLTQALNSIGTTIAPLVLSVLVFTAAGTAMGAKAVQLPFLIIGTMVILIGIGLLFIKLPEISTQGEQKKSIWKYPHVLLGAIGIFAYVGAEVGTAAMIVPYLTAPLLGGLTAAIAAKYAAIYWGGAMIGRFFGSIMLSNIADSTKKYTYVLLVLAFAFIAGWYITGYSLNDGLMFMGISVASFLAMQLGRSRTSITLAVFAAIAAILELVTMGTSGMVAMWAVISIGFFNSVMFPNIFALSVDGLDKSEMSMASGLINTLIVGGAVIPLLMGAVADNWSVRYAFLLPVICYAYIVFFALVGSKHK